MTLISCTQCLHPEAEQERGAAGRQAEPGGE